MRTGSPGGLLLREEPDTEGDLLNPGPSYREGGVGRGWHGKGPGSGRTDTGSRLDRGDTIPYAPSLVELIYFFFYGLTN